MRHDPVPPGRYWIDVPQEQFPQWDDLVERNKGAIQIDHHETTFRSVDDDPMKGIDTWFIFFVTAPVSWPHGFKPPNTAPDWIKRRSDVYARPEDPRKHPWRTTAEEAKRAAEEAADWARGEFMPLIVIGAALYYLATRRRG